MKVFSLLLSLLLFLSSAQSQGQWGEWGSWSSCSRTCGGGITYQERKCLTNNCVGESKIFRSCNIQDCSNGLGDFRKEQCAAYNSVLYYGKYYEWVPYSGPSDNPCSLSCMPKNEFFYETFTEKVVDGTRCNDSTHDMCVDGTCKKAGCDLILGSDAKEDKCRICNGGGKTCQTIKGSYVGRPKGTGYADILEIPAGATNIFIKEAKKSSNFLALKNSSHSFILNGNRNIKRRYKYKGPGTTIKYKRTRKEESISALGPTTDTLYLSLLSLGGDIAIDYELSVRKSLKVGKLTIEYSWEVGQYGECDRKCNGGKKTRRVYCVRSRDNIEVESSKCHQMPQPEKTTSCNEQPCPPRWFVDSWSPCSRSCGEGTQVRRVHCERETRNGIIMVNENLCPGIKAIAQRKCIAQKECPKWKLGEWSECSKTCGGGTRTRTVQCTEINNNAIDDDKCPENERPFDQETCNDIPCEVRWVTGEWGACRPSCGKGMRTRPVYCASLTETKRRYPDYMCNKDDKPEATKPCSSPKKCPPMWYGSSWSKCTASCGKGMQMRNVFCGVKEQANDYLKILSNDRCKYLPQMKKIQQCTIKPCYTLWVASSWKPCSTTCGDGKRLRDVKCFADSDEDKTGKLCDPRKKPLTEDICNSVDCPDGSNTSPQDEPRTAQTTRSPPTATTPIATRSNTKNLPRPESITRYPTRPTIPIRTQPTTKATTTAVPKVTTKERLLSTRTIMTRKIVIEKNTFINGKSMPAVIVRGPTNDEAVVGSDITIPCEAKGNPKPDIFWLKGNLDVSVFGQRFEVLPNGFLKIVAVQEVDEDLYTCVANNAISRRSQPAYLTVTTRPYVYITPGYTVKEGEEARIQCTISGKPRPTVQWYKDGKTLPFQSNDRLTITPKQISIKSVKLEDQGKYYCRATNKNGVTTGYTMLDILPDDKTILRDILDGNCEDDEYLENCSMAALLKSYCDRPYYKKVCCKTCREKNRANGRASDV